MKLFKKISGLFKTEKSNSSSQLIPETKLPQRITESQYLFCFKGGKKTVLLEAGGIPQTLDDGEFCVVVDDDPFEIEIEIDKTVYKLKLEFDLTDNLAKTLTEGELSAEKISLFSQNALQAVKNVLPEDSPTERWRAKVSLALMAKGLRCIDFAVQEEVLKEEPTEEVDSVEDVKEVLDSIPDELVEEDEIKEIESIIEKSDMLSEQAKSKLERIAQVVYDRIDNQLAESKNIISLEMRLDDSSETKFEEPEQKLYPTALEMILKPSTFFAVRRSTIDKRLGKYIITSVTNSIKAVNTYQKENLQRDFSKLAQASDLLKTLTLCKDRVETLPVLKHSFKDTKLSKAEIKERIKYLKEAVDCTAGTSDTIAELCKTNVKSEDFSIIMKEANNGAEKLNKILARKGSDD